MTIAATSGSAFWFITRGTGVVALILLTITTALGLANASRLRGRYMPRFVVDAVHRNAALLSVCFLAVHVATTVLDGYVPISWLDAIVPFATAYKTFWVGMGVVSLDLLIAVLVTSLLRHRIGHRAWRATHWLAYASWPVALLHSLGTGTDRSTHWMLAVAAGSTITVLAALAVRLASRYRTLEAPAPRPVARPRGARPPMTLAPGGGR